MHCLFQQSPVDWSETGEGTESMIEAVIYDMDGVLLDSEPFWQEAEIEVFASVGLHLTVDDCRETMGIPIEDVVAYRFSQKPWSGKTQEEVVYEILEGVERRVLERGELLPGVRESLQFFSNRRVPVGLASSSPMKLILTVLQKFGLERTFRVVHSAEYEEYGKPHPAVFLSTARHLHVAPERCLVIEDSFNGVIAAKAARMKVLVVPPSVLWDDTRFSLADWKLHSLVELNEDILENINK